MYRSKVERLERIVALQRALLDELLRDPLAAVGTNDGDFLHICGGDIDEYHMDSGALDQDEVAVDVEVTCPECCLQHVVQTVKISMEAIDPEGATIPTLEWIKIRLPARSEKIGELRKDLEAEEVRQLLNPIEPVVTRTATMVRKRRTA